MRNGKYIATYIEFLKTLNFCCLKEIGDVTALLPFWKLYVFSRGIT